MAGRLILHIGMAGTGERRLQHALSEGRAGLFYPASPDGAPHHDAAARELLSAGPVGAGGAFARLLDRVAERGAEVSVISSGLLEAADPLRLRHALEARLPDPHVTVIAYIRPHAERLLAEYRRRIREGLFFGSLAAFLEAARREGFAFCHARFERWSRVFGKALILRPVVAGTLAGDDVVADFLHLATGEAGAPVDPDPDPGPEALATLATLQEGLRGHVPRGAAAAIGRHAERLLAGSNRQVRPPTLPPNLARIVAQTYGADAEATDAAFLAGTPMGDALAILPVTADSLPETRPDPAAARLAAAWSALLADIAALDPESWTDHLARLEAGGISPEGA